jgi:hypothetical protein
MQDVALHGVSDEAGLEKHVGAMEGPQTLLFTELWAITVGVSSCDCIVSGNCTA